MVGKAQPRVEWRQPDQNDMNTNNKTLVSIVCTVIDFDIVDLLFIVLITLSVPETHAQAPRISSETSNCLGLCDVYWESWLCWD